MKKAMKKLMAALLAVAMVCAMAIPAWAEGAAATGTTYTITINNPVGTYKAYQIFSCSATLLYREKGGKAAHSQLHRLYPSFYRNYSVPS